MTFAETEKEYCMQAPYREGELLRTPGMEAYGKTFREHTLRLCGERASERARCAEIGWHHEIDALVPYTWG